ncbi:DNA utilization protein GntX [Pasteurella bettyae]|nr:DNA utilization protein GntX [Pasteurella bettyae]SUB22882.1 competence protein F [Pasteurella bettyae]
MNWFGFRCIACHRSLAIPSHGICSYCHREIKRFNYCGCCGAQLPINTLHCGNCLRNMPSWHRMVIIGSYQPPLSILIHQFKFQNSFHFDRTLARLLFLAIREARCSHALPMPEVILPVPLHHLRQWQRGYNQADLLAQQLAKWLSIPCDNRLLKRIKHTHTQRGLTAIARRKNLLNAFCINKVCHYKSVALVDDVITTGATLNEIAKLLKRYGVEHIQVWGLARV